jgi:transketolase C-terminal domain/subunit
MLVKRIGINDRFGQSGTVAELFEHYNLNPEYIVEQAKKLL